MKQKLKLLLGLIILPLAYSFPQLSTPEPESVYGGIINAISVIQTSASTSRIFVSTESANSIFYADVTSTGTPSFGSFNVMPGVGDDDGYGSRITNISAEASSGYLFFVNNGNLYSTHPSSSSVTTIYSPGVSGMIVYGGYLFFLESNHLRWGTINSTTGAFTENAASPLTLAGTAGMPKIVINPSNSKIYVAEFGTMPPSIYKSSDNYNAIGSSTTFSLLSTSSLSSSMPWAGFGIGSDGTLFFNGNNNPSGKIIAHSTNDGTTWTSASTGVEGIGGSNFAFQASGSNYVVYFAKVYSTFNTTTKSFGSWSTFGNVGFETHPNDGPVAADPLNASILYFATDQGLGATENGGANIFEIDDGIEAVQVKDFDMNSGKSDAWLASKSGIRYVSGYGTAPSWSYAIFPNGDGSPYYSAEMIKNNQYSAFVGNLRVYKTQDKGNSWTQVFTAENAPYNFSSIGSYVKAIEVYSSDTNLVACGYTLGDTLQGGFFYSTDGGTNWNQKLLKATSGYNDADINDIIFTTEGGNPVAYIGVTYDMTIAISSRARSVYRAEWSGGSWSVRNDFDASYTSTGTAITATVNDLHASLTGDTLFACGTDAGTNHPILYYKIISGTNKWTPFTTSGFPASAGKVGKAVTFGNDTVYCAVDNDIYIMRFAGSSWTIGYSYAVGNEINVLYYDDLIVGTGTGAYSQRIILPTNASEPNANIKTYSLEQNFPNPFNPSTVIKFSVPEESVVELKIFDLLGKEIKTLLSDYHKAGSYKVLWNSDDNSGNIVASGVYFVRLTGKNFSISRKMLLVR